MHFTHIKLKPTIKLNANFRDTANSDSTSEETQSVDLSKKYHKTNKLSDELGYDLLLGFEDSIIYGFDYLHDKRKLIIPEINPTTIFYSNAVMFHRNLILSKDTLFEQSPDFKNFQTPINPRLFGEYFQFSSNCLINLQSTIESFANRQIPIDYFVDENGEEYEVSIFHKIDSVIPKLKGKKFKQKFKKDNFRVRKVIELRNEIIHLKPINDITNTQYKNLYRRILKFDFSSALTAVRNFVNFYEPGLIEECTCGKEYFYQLSIKDKE